MKDYPRCREATGGFLTRRVASRTILKRTERNNSHIISGNVADAIRKVKEQQGKDIALFAGAGLARSFMQICVIDEYRILLSPALIGGGTRLFQDGYEPTSLRLLQMRPFRSGAIGLFHKPEGELRGQTS